MYTDTVHMTLPEHRIEEQSAILAEVIRAAEAAWGQMGHPGWHAGQQEGQPLLDHFRQVESPYTACY